MTPSVLLPLGALWGCSSWPPMSVHLMGGVGGVWGGNAARSQTLAIGQVGGGSQPLPQLMTW